MVPRAQKATHPVKTGLGACAGVALGAWLAGASGAVAQSLLVDEMRLGLLVHSVEASNGEDGSDLNIEVLFRTSSYILDGAFLDALLRPRLHLGGSVNLAGETSQLYAGFTWDAKLAPGLSLELSFGAALHNGPTGDGHEDSYGCVVNFRQSV
jgi:hypothetical protein